MLVFEFIQFQFGIIFKYYGFKVFCQGVYCVNYLGEVFCLWLVESDELMLREIIGLLNNFIQWFQNGVK